MLRLFFNVHVAPGETADVGRWSALIVVVSVRTKYVLTFNVANASEIPGASALGTAMLQS